MRAWALGIGTCLVLAGCFDRHGPAGDAGSADDGGIHLCSEAAAALAVGARCDFPGTCTTGGACCTETWRCEDGVVARNRVCSEVCRRSCDDAATAAIGDPCEGAFECASFDETLCCARSVRCVESHVAIEESCAPGCVGACEGYVADPTARPCRSSADCEGPTTMQCLAPGETSCGACHEPIATCESDADCASGDRCVERPDPCACGGGTTTLCVPDCAIAGCPHDQRCLADGGCARDACTSDAECSCGACVNGLCADGPGACRPPAP